MVVMILVVVVVVSGSHNSRLGDSNRFRYVLWLFFLHVFSLLLFHTCISLFSQSVR
jgi:hypothetical protein